MRQLLLGGPQFKVITDHKPLTYMFSKSHGELPPRVERCVMDLQEYDYVVEHQPGKDCIADYMSRNHIQRQGTSAVRSNEKTVKKLIRAEVCQAIAEDFAITMQDIKEATEDWELSTCIKRMINEDTNIQDNPELEPFIRIREQLSIVGGVICKNNKIVIPPKLQKKTVRICHRAHQGMTKTKSFARSFCWFPGLDNMIEEKVRSCRQYKM